jgi:RimJ/RimL family protein N-acetyltransferase
LLVQIGRDEKLERITASILADNREMEHMARKAGFTFTQQQQGSERLATLNL